MRRAITRYLFLKFSFAPPLFNAFLYFGQYGVTLFFVLSGFLLFLPFAKALLFGHSRPSTRHFYVRRIFRIMPAYYLLLLLIVLLFQQQYLLPQPWKELGLFFTFFMDSTSTTFKQLNAPFWTLAIEWQYYMLLPLLVLGMRLIAWRIKQDFRLPATVACLLARIGWGLFSLYVGTYSIAQHPSATFLFPRPLLNGILFFIYGISGKYLEDFGVGMLLSLCFVYAQHPSTSPHIRTTLCKMSPWLWGTGLLCLLAMISYSLYMWHLPLLLVLINLGQPFLRSLPPLLAYGAYCLWVLLVIIPFCFLFFLWVEKFGERFKRQKATTRTSSTEASAPVSEMSASENKKVSETDVPRQEPVSIV